MLKKVGLLVLTLSLFIRVVHSQDWEDVVKESVKNNNIGLLQGYLIPENINVLFSGGKGNALIYAIQYQSPKIVKFLLDNHANPDFKFLSQTSLMLAVQQHDLSIVRMLIKQGASVNWEDSAGNTALMLASTNSNVKFAKLLIRHGAFLNKRNKAGHNARDFAVRSNNNHVSAYLRSVFEANLPNYFDGPYVTFLGKRKIKVNYFRHDSLHRRTDSYLQHFKLKSLKGEFHGFVGDTNSYILQTGFNKPSTEQNNVQKLLMIGDIHGQYDTLRIFLQNNHVIDENLHWTFGNGTVVFVGDIFDRGEKVTEALWLIYNLEREAIREGGRVNLLLGNHEIMAMNGDYRFISDKYYFIFNNLKLSYSRYYNNKTLMGRWLRSKNTFLKVDSFLFVHGGINPNLLNYNVSLDSINILISNYLSSNHKAKFSGNKLLSFLLSYDGPFWYRGMVDQMDGTVLPDEEVMRILNYYHVKYIVVGHTYHSELKFFSDGRILSIDIAFYLPDGCPMQALLLEGQNLLILDSKGGRKHLKDNSLYD